MQYDSSVIYSFRSSNCFLLHKNDNRSFDDKEIGNGIVVIDYYDAVRVAYQNSIVVREYLRCALEMLTRT
jgi:hypothetical protein